MGHYEWNPRYVAYAKINGKTPEEMLEVDTVAFPGGKMCGFTLWIQANIRKFKEISPDSFFYGKLHNQYAFTKFLEEL